jgi:hypothetical protein
MARDGVRLRDPGLEFLKTDPLMDPLRQEPRFQAIERELKFPVDGRPSLHKVFLRSGVTGEDCSRRSGLGMRYQDRGP